MKLSVPYSNLNDIFTDPVQKYLKANKLSVNAIKGDSEGKFIVMFSNKGAESKFLSDFIKEVEEYKGYTSMDAKNINVARALTNTEIKQIVDMLNKNLPLISKKIMSNATFQNTFKDILGKYTFQFSIDSFIKKDKNTFSESAIKNFTKLQETSQTLKVEPPFEKWTSGDVKEAPKQKKVSTLPVELEVKVIATPIEQKINAEQEPRVKTTESILRSLDITMPKHLKEEGNQEGKETQPQSTNTKVLTLDSLKVLRDYFVKYAQKLSFSIRTKENSQLINGLPVVFGNGKDKYLKVDQNGMTGLFTIQAALGEQNTLTKMANRAYKNNNAFKSPQDTSSVVL